ncbi:YfbR-like 5'-deoxynucleotidase [Bacillus mexicanus]|uniref:YfbR-like 5'-deoxynucleotidase n=1 Tax=Bacillus mexicanus TaxID=2834415 RepID=UPI003D21F7DB
MTRPKNSELFHIFYRLSVVPRWEDFSPKYNDSTASHSYRVAVLSLLIGLIEKEKHNRKLDIERILGRAIFHDFNEVINGPIKHRTKKNKIVHNFINEIEKVASEDIASFVSKSLKGYFYDYIVNAEDGTEEGRIVDLADTFDVFLFSAREVKALNKIHFQDFYRNSKKTLLNSEFKSIRELVAEFEKNDSPTRKLLNAVLRMDQINRWSGRFNTFPDNDATHTFRAAAMGIFFALYEKEKHGIEIDLQRLVGKILFHDLPEAISGDVNGPVKHQSKEIKEAFEEYERKVAKDILKWVPDSIKGDIEDYLIYPKDATKEGIRVDIVDKIDGLLKCLLEMKRNSREYELAYKRQLDSIQGKFFDYPSIKFFLSTILHDLYFASEFEK